LSRNEFLQTLESLLHAVPEMDRREMLYDYEEHFQIGVENGKSLNELTEELGDPYTIARDILADYHGAKLIPEKKKRGVGKKLFIGFGMFLFNVLFIAAPVVALFAVVISFWLVALVLTLSPFVLITSSFLGYSYESFAVNFFVSLTLLSLGMLLGIGMINVTKYFYRVMIRYGRFNVRVVRGGEAV
jgi:uncharacterized membrane protein